MADLIVVGFEGTRRAAEVLAQVEMLNSIWAIELKDAVAVYRTDDGRLHLDQSVHPTTKEAAVLGGALGALIGAAPFSAFAALIAIPVQDTPRWLSKAFMDLETAAHQCAAISVMP